jgi:predicted DNA-binding transcriptional regulator AlpA
MSTRKDTDRTPEKYKGQFATIKEVQQISGMGRLSVLRAIEDGTLKSKQFRPRATHLIPLPEVARVLGPDAADRILDARE